MFVQGPQYESVPFPSSRRRRRRRRLRRRRLRRRRRRRRSSSSRSSGRKTTALAAAADRIIFLVIFAVVDIVGWFFLLANNIRWTTPRAGEIRTCSYKACSTESYPSPRVVFSPLLPPSSFSSPIFAFPLHWRKRGRKPTTTSLSSPPSSSSAGAAGKIFIFHYCWGPSPSIIPRDNPIFAHYWGGVFKRPSAVILRAG